MGGEKKSLKGRKALEGGGRGRMEMKEGKREEERREREPEEPIYAGAGLRRVSYVSEAATSHAPPDPQE